MSLADEYREARRSEAVARLRRVLALRALSASGLSQRAIAATVGVSQPAVSQQLSSAPDPREVEPDELLEAAAPVLKALAAEHGYTRLAVFGSVARGTARADSDIDLLVEAPEGASTFDLVSFQRLLEQVLGRRVDLLEYGGLDHDIDSDIRNEAVPL